MKVYTYTYEAGGCSPEGSHMEVYMDRPETGDPDFYEVKTYDVPEGVDGVWALVVRTARCCGTDSVIADLFHSEVAAREAAQEYRRVHPRPALNDSEWEQFGEDGWADAPLSAEARRLPLVKWGEGDRF